MPLGDARRVPATCGVMITFAMAQSGCSAGSGSVSNTSSPAPAISPARGRRQVGQIDDHAAADVDQIAGPLHLAELRSAEELESLRRVRRGDDDEVARAEEVGEPVAGQSAATPGGASVWTGSTATPASRTPGPPGDLGPDVAQADDAEGGVRQVEVGAIHGAPRAGPVTKPAGVRGRRRPPRASSWLRT